MASPMKDESYSNDCGRPAAVRDDADPEESDPLWGNLGPAEKAEAERLFRNLLEQLDNMK